MGTYSDGHENGSLFNTFHVRNAASFIGMEGHDDSPAFGEDFDQSLVISDENISRRSTYRRYIRILRKSAGDRRIKRGSNVYYGGFLRVMLSLREGRRVKEAKVTPLDDKLIVNQWGVRLPATSKAGLGGDASSVTSKLRSQIDLPKITK